MKRSVRESQPCVSGACKNVCLSYFKYAEDLNDDNVGLHLAECRSGELVLFFFLCECVVYQTCFSHNGNVENCNQVKCGIHLVL